jgi:glycosyltransferase involved in cell wall biosynthesis
MSVLVTVVIRTYNRSALVTSAIESALNQTHRPVDVMVVDDGSTDATEAVVRRYGDRVRYVRQSHAGVAAALNTGLGKAQGDYLAFLDDDDLWQEQMLERSLSVLEVAGDEVGVTYVGSRYFSNHDTTRLIDPGWTGRSGDIFGPLLENNFIPINAVLIKKRCLEVVGGCDDALRGYEDWDLFLRIALAGFAFRYIDEPLALIRRHPAHQSSDVLMMKRNALAVVSKLDRSPGLSPETRREVRRALAKRRLSLGWYLMLQNRCEEGEEELRAASPVGLLQRAQQTALVLLTTLGAPALLRNVKARIESSQVRRP